MGKISGPIYTIESYNANKKQYGLVPRFGKRFASLFPEKLYASQDIIDPLLKDAGYLPGDVPISEPFLVEIQDVESDKVKRLHKFVP